MYSRVFDMLPPLDRITTNLAKAFHRCFDELITENWPLDKIPDAVLLAIYLNPACASSPWSETRVNGTSLSSRAQSVAVRALIAHYNAKVENQLGSDLCENEAERMDEEDEYANQQIAELTVNLYDRFVKANRDKLATFRDTPHLFWQSRLNHVQLGALGLVALSCLCVQATSSSAERSFSHAGLFLSAKRTKTADRNFQNSLLCGSFANILMWILKFKEKQHNQRVAEMKNRRST